MFVPPSGKLYLKLQLILLINPPAIYHRNIPARPKDEIRLRITVVNSREIPVSLLNTIDKNHYRLMPVAVSFQNLLPNSDAICELLAFPVHPYEPMSPRLTSTKLEVSTLVVLE
jgi:hypothetical protein